LSAGQTRTHGLEHFQRIAAAVLQAAAVLVGALVGQRRNEGRHQVAVGGMELDQVKVGAGGTARGGDEIGLDPIHVGARHFRGTCDTPAM
jgi:hypothetical protein